ncbi:MAG TPA: hypothetical protein VH740_13265, partial [Vicinamibacterales bacterium]
RIQDLMPRVDRISSVFDELQSVFEAGRRTVASAPDTTISRPTLLVPAAPTPRRTKRVDPAVEVAPATPVIDEWHVEAPDVPRPPEAPAAESDASPTPDEPTTTFRLEFESRPGPLDLRAVDDAVSQHPAVRDVALLDYDGRRATLKVWITATTSPAEVQETLAARAASIGNGNEISIVALEDVA